MRHIIQEFQRITLVYPDIHFELFNGSDCVYELPVSNIRQRITAVFGKKMRNISQQLVQIEAKPMITPCSVNDCVKPDLERRVPIAERLPSLISEFLCLVCIS